MTTVEVLRAARAKIEQEDDWFGGGRPCNRPDQLCAATAMGEVEDMPWAAWKTFGQAVGVDVDYVPGACGFTRIWAWNDAPDRTHPEVLAAFDKAIELALLGATMP